MNIDAGSTWATGGPTEVHKKRMKMGEKGREGAGTYSCPSDLPVAWWPPQSTFVSFHLGYLPTLLMKCLHFESA